MRLHRTWLPALGLSASLALLAACAVPLGPGYRLRRETVTVHYRPGLPGVRYTVHALVRNIGNRPLDSVKIQVSRRLSPPAPAPAQSSAAAASAPNGLEMQFPLPMRPPLARKESREIRFGYMVPGRGQAILLEPDDWFPTFVPPHALFAKGEPLARKTELRIFVPAGYSALTSGRLRERRVARPGGETEYTYEKKSRDFLPFLLVGRFQRQKIRRGKVDVVFWTRQGLPAACAESMGAHLASADALYRSLFGSIGKSRRPIPVIEIPPESLRWMRVSEGGFGSVPGGLWFSVSPSRLCAQPERYFRAADKALAATWFGWAVAPQAGALGFLDGGARRYAALLAEKADATPQARTRQVRDWLGEYDRLRRRSKPVAPDQVTLASSAIQRKMAGIQSALCLIALQDRFGREAVEKALAHLVSSLRGGAAGLDEARSALEEATGRNLFDFFRQWQGRAGIPPAFRKRYAAANRAGAKDEISISHSRRAR